MSWSLRNQMVLPLVIFVSLLIFLASYNRAALQIVQANQRAVQIYNNVADDLADEKFDSLASRLHAHQREHHGWHFIVIRDHTMFVSTVDLIPRQQAILATLPPAASDIAGFDEILLGTDGMWYYVIPIRVPGWPSSSFLVCLEPYQSIAATITGAYRNSGWAALGISAVLIGAAALYSNRLSRRVVRIQHQVQRIAAGDLSQTADESGRDEIAALAHSVNAMAADLTLMKAIVRDTERARLYSQLAGGLAHELRNGIHAARLTIEVFQDTPSYSRCESRGLLENAREQLSVTETLVRRLLALGRPQQRDLRQKSLSAILNDAFNIIEPVCRHTEVALSTRFEDELNWTAEDGDTLQAAIVNLCLNAIEAAGRHGDVRLEAISTPEEIQIHVSDSGPGPQAAVAENLFDPFVTTKPEGIGLGLVLVKQAAEEAGGRVDWERKNDRTVFTIRLTRSQA